MKNLLLFLALVPIMASAQKVELLPKASISYCNEKMRITDENGMGRYTYSMPPVNVRTGLEMRYKHISLYYDTKIWCRTQGLKFSPEQAVFEIGASYAVCGKIKISISHNCYHAIKCDDGERHPGLYGGKNEITISYGY